jgi:hypothetical protein
MKKILFLDLEDTIIEPVLTGWHNFIPKNMDEIKRFIQEEKFEEISIFSFAIWDQTQKKQFEKSCQKWLEKELNIPFTMVPTIDDEILQSCCKQKKIHPQTIDFKDIVDFWSKDLSFILCIKDWFQNEKDVDILLLDDAVEDMDIHIKQNNMMIRLKNVDRLIENLK